MPSFRVRSGFAHACLLAAAFLAGCENPLTDDGGKDAKTDPADSVDAQKGQDLAGRYDFLQGKFLATGQAMDLAIEGKGLFVLKNEAQYVFFRRPAMFSQDSLGYLHLGNARTRLQGVRLHSDTNPYPMPGSGTRADLAALEDVRWLAGDRLPARPTALVMLGRNLPVDAAGKGSLLYTQAFLHHAEPGDLLLGLQDSKGTDLGIRAGDVLTLSATNPGSGAAVSTGFTVTAQSTLADLASAMTSFFRGEAVGAGLGTTVDLVTNADSFTMRGALSIYGNTAAIRDFLITSSRPVSGPSVARAFSVPAEIRPGTTRLSTVTETLRSPALAQDRLVEAFDSQGNGLGLDLGDVISFSGSIGKLQAQNVTPLVYAANTTLGDLLSKVRENFELRQDMAILNPAGSDDNIADGAMVIKGHAGKEWALLDVSIRSTDANNAKPSPNFFNTNMNFTTWRAATDSKLASCTFEVIDAAGMARRLSLVFTPVEKADAWKYKVTLDSGITMAGDQERTLQFAGNGTLSGPGATHSLAIRPLDGTPATFLTLDFSGLTQVGDTNTVAMISQDGVPAGILETIAIGEDGIISGDYSNGKSRALFQLPLANFPNPGGLKRIGDNSFLESAESGKAVMSLGSDPAGGSIRSGEVEYVNETERSRVCEVFPGC